MQEMNLQAVRIFFLWGGGGVFGCSLSLQHSFVPCQSSKTVQALITERKWFWLSFRPKEEVAEEEVRKFFFLNKLQNILFNNLGSRRYSSALLFFHPVITNHIKT